MTPIEAGFQAPRDYPANEEDTLENPEPVRPPKTRATLENRGMPPQVSVLFSFQSLPASGPANTLENPKPCARRKSVPGSKFAAFWRIFVPGSNLPLRNPDPLPSFSYPSLLASGPPNRLENPEPRVRRKSVPGSKFAVLWRIFVPGSNLPHREIPTRFPAIVIRRVSLRLISRPSQNPEPRPRLPALAHSRKPRPFSYLSLPAAAGF